jgi:D-alanyl-D-alanine endopeptidase (penicillin-binding protein 7)
MKNKLQILTLFAIAVVVLLGARGFAKREDVILTANISDAAGVLAAPAEVSAFSDNQPAGEAKSAILGGISAIAPRSIFYRFANDPAPATSAEATLIADVQSGDRYLEIQSDKRWPIASLSKLMTATVVLEKIDTESLVTIEDADFADGENPVFVAGDTFRAKDLLKVMLVASRNTAANAFARTYGKEAFLRAMNEKAKSYGMCDTNLSDPSGLSVANQSTLGDLLKLVRGISLEHPDIWKMTENARMSIKDSGSGKFRSFTSTNQFVNRADFYGGKTGYTLEADGNLLTVFLYGKRTIVIIVLGSSDRFGDSENLFNWFKNDFKPSN